MFVSHLAIKNVRGFQDVDIALSEPGWTVVAGRNGAGKTTLLRAIALAAAGPDAARTLADTFRGWVRTGESAASVSVWMGGGDHDSYQGPGAPGGTFHGKLTWSLGADDVEPGFRAEPKPDKRLKGPWRAAWHNNPRGWFVAGYGPFRRLSGHATGAERLMVTSNHVSRLVSLFREDASLAECVQWLKSVYTQRLEKRPGAAELEATILDLLNDGLLPDGTRVTHVDSEGPWVTQASAKLPLRELSDGYRVVVALVLDLVWQMHQCFGDLHVKTIAGVVTIGTSGLVLIDEIDAHLHVSWQQRIGPWLKQHFPKVQFVVTTHSPFICQAADALIRLPAPGESGTAEEVSDEVFRRVVGGTTDDALLSELFGLERTWSDTTEARRRRLDVLRTKELRGEATPQERKEALRLAKDFPVTPSRQVAEALADVKEMWRAEGRAKGAV